MTISILDIFGTARGVLFAAVKGKAKGKAKPTGGRWITIGGDGKGGYRRLYVKGKGKGAKVLAGGGASPSRPKTIGQVIAEKPKERAKAVGIKAGVKKPAHDNARDFDGKPPADVESYHKDMSKDWSSKLAAADKDSLATYSGADFLNTNNALRKGSLDAATGYTKKQVASLDASLGKSGIKEPVTVYRGVSDLKAIGLDPSKLTGATLQDKAFLSTSLTPDIARKFAGKDGAVLRINAPAGSKGASLSGASWLAHEREVLFARNAKLTVRGSSRDETGRLIIDMDISHD